ncbi:MAG: sn-glycerol-3-phosphate ABC transporter permease UgpE [Hyphomicrobiaceae bacterium]|nr:sn-glycerol-3-phosphate ABC transporter permease UgpE [Hyphomicrobiaceae bacterium]
MIERTPVLNALTHVTMALGLVLLILPIWIVFVASTHDYVTVNRVPLPLWPGSDLIANYSKVWATGNFGQTMLNSLVVAIGVTAGKIILASLSAFSIVFFRYRLRMVFFWLIFITLMLPLEVRIVPTYAVASNALSPFQQMFDWLGIAVALPEWNLLNSYTGLILPLVATATGTFLYRQFFLTIPDELAEAARMDGAGPIRFFIDVLLPLSRNNMAALATIMFVYAWNQYLWPLLITTRADMQTAATQLQKIVPGPLFGQPPVWNEAMAATLLVMAPPLLVVIFMQRWFVRGLIAADK